MQISTTYKGKKSEKFIFFTKKKQKLSGWLRSEMGTNFFPDVKFFCIRNWWIIPILTKMSAIIKN